MMAKVETTRRNLDPEKPDILIFGTCLGDQALEGYRVEAALGPAGRIHSLTAPGSTPVDWYLSLRSVLRPGDVDLVLVVYTPGDLYLSKLNWQTQTLDLTDWTSIREVGDWTCADVECRAELALRKASLLYRNRAYLANRVWTTLGARDGASPLATSSQSYTPPDAHPAHAAWHFVGRMAELAAERKTPLAFLELPANPEFSHAPGAELQAEEREEARRRLRELGGQVISPPAPAGGFMDDVHYNGFGRRAITDAVIAYVKELQAKR